MLTFTFRIKWRWRLSWSAFLNSRFVSFDYICLFCTTAHLLWKLLDWGHEHNHHGLYAHFQLPLLMSSGITLDAQNTIYIYWVTSDHAEQLQNLLTDFRIYWTTSEFYWTTWDLSVIIFVCYLTRRNCTIKHRKNCECCPVSQLIVIQQRLSWIQVLNCQNCNQCLKCHKS